MLAHDHRSGQCCGDMGFIRELVEQHPGITVSSKMKCHAGDSEHQTGETKLYVTLDVANMSEPNGLV